jgi:hypothetical protein
MDQLGSVLFHGRQFTLELFCFRKLFLMTTRCVESVGVEVLLRVLNLFSQQLG